MPALNVWMNAEFVGTWHVGSGRVAVHSFEYAPDWIASERARPLSLSIPLGPHPVVSGLAVMHYFQNLLPDNEAILDRIRARYRARSKAPIDLLTAIGRDCVGAVQLLPLDVPPPELAGIDASALTEREVEALLAAVVAAPGLGVPPKADDFLRISIAGAQEKTALLRRGDQWLLPHGATPTTHILKLPLGIVAGGQMDLRASVENEWLCSRFLHHLGLPVAQTEIASFGATKALIVERFDREFSADGRRIIRVPQEDFCQALGLSANAKYESHGGPGMDTCLRLLGGSETPELDRMRFLGAQLAFWLLAAPDGHAKNFSIFLKRGSAYQLTPLYDVLSAWPVIGKRAGTVAYGKFSLAMALRGKNPHYHFKEIAPRHWREQALRCGVADAWPLLCALVERVEPALLRTEADLPADFPMDVWDAVAAGVRRHAALFCAVL